MLDRLRLWSSALLAYGRITLALKTDKTPAPENISAGGSWSYPA